jgi:hypothetical protein
VRQLNTVDTIRETLTESNTRRKIINIVLALTRANDKLKVERKFLESFLQDFNDQIIINEDNDLFFN